MEDRIEGLRKRARRYLDANPPVAVKKQRRDDIVINTMNPAIDALDRISQFPDHLLLHIVSFLPSTRDVVCLSGVSKTWYRIWTLSPIWDFSEFFFGLSSSNLLMGHSEIQDRRLQFLNFVHNSLLRQSHQKTSLDQFRLSMTIGYDFKPASLVDRLFELLVQCGVKELDLCFNRNWQLYYLPQTIFSATALTVFRLCGGCLKLCQAHEPICWSSLRVLYLSEAYVGEHIIQSLIFGCPLIEQFSLLNCSGLKSVHLSGFPNLGTVEVVDTRGVIERIKIDALSLQTFYYCARPIVLGPQHCHLDVTACKNLEALKLKHVDLSKRALQELISEFPAIKILSFCAPSFSSIFYISSQCLETLQLSPIPPMGATIIAPNLRSLKCATDTLYSEFSLDSSCLQKVALKLSWDEHEPDISDFLRLRKHLGNFNQINLLSLQIIPDKISFLPESLNGTFIPPLPDIKNLKLKITPSSDYKDEANTQKNYETLLNGLLWVCHPESMLLKPGCGSNNKLIKVLCETLWYEAKRNCCMSSGVKCWRHKLKGVEIKHWEGNGCSKVLTPDALLNSLPTLAPQQKISFNFKW